MQIYGKIGKYRAEMDTKKTLKKGDLCTLIIKNDRMKVSNLIVLATTVVFVSCNRNNAPEQYSQQFNLMEIKAKDISLNSTYSASIRGQQDIKIIPRVDGYLTDILIKEGSKVREGQTLFVLDQVSFKAALQAAKATVAICEANIAEATLVYNSKKALHDKQVVSDFDLTSAENALNIAKANLQQAKAQEDAARNDLSFTVIKSPSDGVVGKIPYRKGDYVSPNIPDGLTIVSNNSQMYLYFSISERQVIDLVHKYGQLETAIAEMPDVQLKLSNNEIYNQKGRVESISGIVDPSTGAVSIRAVFPNKSGLLFSGGAGSVIMPYNCTNVIVIPQESTYEIQDKTYVYRVLNGMATSTIVTVDKINNGKEYIVTDGLNINDIIIAEGAGLVQEGAKVQNTTNKEQTRL